MSLRSVSDLIDEYSSSSSSARIGPRVRHGDGDDSNLPRHGVTVYVVAGHCRRRGNCGISASWSVCLTS